MPDELPVSVDGPTTWDCSRMEQFTLRSIIGNLFPNKDLFREARRSMSANLDGLELIARGLVVHSTYDSFGFFRAAVQIEFLPMTLCNPGPFTVRASTPYLNSTGPSDIDVQLASLPQKRLGDVHSIQPPSSGLSSSSRNPRHVHQSLRPPLGTALYCVLNIPQASPSSVFHRAPTELGHAAMSAESSVDAGE